MGVTAPAAAKASGLSTVLDTIVAPKDAFERLRTTPTWGWALIVAIALLLIGTFIQGPAMRHASAAQVQHMIANSPMYANMTDAQKQKILENASKPSPWGYAGAVVTVFLAAFFNTIILLIGNAVGRGQADFKRLWCGSVNIAVPTLGLSSLVLGIIAIIRGADAFPNTFALVGSIPSLAMIAPAGNFALTGFLAGISVFTLWGLYLNATMMRVTAKTSAGVAYTFAAIVLLLGAIFAAAGMVFSHKMGML